MKAFVIFVILLIFTGSTFAQGTTWTPGENGFEFNCSVLEQVQAAIANSETKFLEIAELPLVRVNKIELSVERYLALILIVQFQNDADISLDLTDILGVAINTCNKSDTGNSDRTNNNSNSFNVTATGNANLRSCAGTTCEVVGQVSTGAVLKVIATDGDWYQVEHEGKTAFIASFLTARAPDNLISTDDPYLDPRTGCIVAFDIKRGNADLSIIITGNKRGNVVVDLYRPNESKALKVEGQLDKTFSDTGDPYIYQYYRYNIGWPVGIYGLEFTLNGQTSKVAWEIRDRADYNIYVVCN